MNSVKELIDSTEAIGEKYGLYLSTARGICSDIARGYYSYARSTFLYLESLVFGMLEDFKIIESLIVLSFEKKAQIKARLLDNNLLGILKALENAEENIKLKKPRDAADRCREALEKIVEEVIKILGGKNIGFEGNLTALVKRGVIDVGTKRDYTGFYAYLAQADVHGKIKESEIDMEYILSMTYLKIERMLEKLIELKKVKTK